MIQLPELKDWRDVPEIKDAVGSGSYTANPDVPASVLNDDTDVLIDIGAMHGAMQLSVNGMVVTQQTTPGGRWPVRKLLKPGKNEITGRVDTLLINRVIQQEGSNAMTYPSGLIGPVQLIPVALARVP